MTPSLSAARLEKDQMWKKNIIVYPTGPFTFDELTGMPSVPPPSAPAAAPPRAAPAYRPAPAFTTTSYGVSCDGHYHP